MEVAQGVAEKLLPCKSNQREQKLREHLGTDSMDAARSQSVPAALSNMKFKVKADGGISDEVCTEIVESIRVVPNFPKPVSSLPRLSTDILANWHTFWQLSTLSSNHIYVFAIARRFNSCP